MSPINITNLLVKIASQNNIVNNNNINRNVNTPSNQTQTTASQNQNTLTPQASIQPQTQNVNINLNNNVNNILNREFINRQIMNNLNNNSVQNQNAISSSQYTPNAVNTNNTFINPNLVANNLQNGQNQIIQQANTLLPNSNIVSQQNNLPVQNSVLGNFFNAQQNAKIINENITSLNTQNSASKILTLSEKNQNINYVKDMMKLPQDIKDVLSILQQTQTSQANTADNNRLLLLSNINIKNLTQLIQTGSKEALQYIMSTSVTQNLSKTEMKQLEEAVTYLNASASSQESQTQALKNFMLLYLPWLPLEEGMDFNLDFSFKEGSEEDDENILNIVIMTKSFGEIHILIILKAMNSFEIYIQCCKNFPKNKLLKLIDEEERKYTMQTNMVFEEQAEFTPKQDVKEAKITLSHVKEISPFLLLIANSLIKNIFLLDAQYSKKLN